MARRVRKSRVKEVSLSEIKDDLSRYLREAETHEIVITRHGKPAGVLIGFESEEDRFNYRIEHDPRFLRRIEVDAKEIRIMGSKSVLLRTLVAASSGKTAGFGVPSFVPKWRTRHDSNV